ncbi:MAG: hypothetical protein BroJett021_08730 [Chloroflexota bacterium]|nr:MAG: hypothetical protein BroJett021_08730 [Chloroflexota bacterium]
MGWTGNASIGVFQMLSKGKTSHPATTGGSDGIVCAFAGGAGWQSAIHRVAANANAATQAKSGLHT